MSKNTIIMDQVTLENYRKFNYATACEDCVHFDAGFNNNAGICTFSYPTAPHRRAQQIKDLETTRRMAFCRAIEID